MAQQRLGGKYRAGTSRPAAGHVNSGKVGQGVNGQEAQLCRRTRHCAGQAVWRVVPDEVGLTPQSQKRRQPDRAGERGVAAPPTTEPRASCMFFFRNCRELDFLCPDLGVRHWL